MDTYPSTPAYDFIVHIQPSTSGAAPGTMKYVIKNAASTKNTLGSYA